MEACDRGARHRLVRADKQPFLQPQKDASCVEAGVVDKIYPQLNEGYSRYEKEVRDPQNGAALCVTCFEGKATRCCFTVHGIFLGTGTIKTVSHESLRLTQVQIGITTRPGSL